MTYACHRKLMHGKESPFCTAFEVQGMDVAGHACLQHVSEGVVMLSCSWQSRQAGKGRARAWEPGMRLPCMACWPATSRASCPSATGARFSCACACNLRLHYSTNNAGVCMQPDLTLPYSAALGCACGSPRERTGQSRNRTLTCFCVCSWEDRLWAVARCWLETAIDARLAAQDQECSEDRGRGCLASELALLGPGALTELMADLELPGRGVGLEPGSKWPPDRCRPSLLW